MSSEHDGESSAPPDLPEGPPPTEDPEHRDDGLDLARALTRATARSTPAARTTRRRRPDSPSRGRVSGAHPDDRDPQLLDTTLHRLVDDHGWELDLRVHGVFGRWEELVGAEVAQHCTPESFADGRLVVRTDSTAWATQPTAMFPTSTAFRASLGAFSKIYSDEYASKGIRINNVMPGWIDSLSEVDERRDSVPMERYGKSEEIAATIAFLLSEGAGYITGQSIRVDGGVIRSV